MHAVVLFWALLLAQLPSASGASPPQPPPQVAQSEKTIEQLEAQLLELQTKNKSLRSGMWVLVIGALAYGCYRVLVMIGCRLTRKWVDSQLARDTIPDALKALKFSYKPLSDNERGAIFENLCLTLWYLRLSKELLAQVSKSDRERHSGIVALQQFLGKVCVALEAGAIAPRAPNFSEVSLIGKVVADLSYRRAPEMIKEFADSIARMQAEFDKRVTDGVDAELSRLDTANREAAVVHQAAKAAALAVAEETKKLQKEAAETLQQVQQERAAIERERLTVQGKLNELQQLREQTIPRNEQLLAELVEARGELGIALELGAHELVDWIVRDPEHALELFAIAATLPGLKDSE